VRLPKDHNAGRILTSAIFPHTPDRTGFPALSPRAAKILAMPMGDAARHLATGWFTTRDEIRAIAEFSKTLPPAAQAALTSGDIGAIREPLNNPTG
jgi:hypothetical protein